MFNLFPDQKSLHNNVVVVSQLLAALEVLVTRRSVKEELESHADFPSLLSISDALKKWGIATRTFRVSPEKFRAIPVPFITSSSKDSGLFITITAVTDEIVSYGDPSLQQGVSRVPVPEFLEHWDGIALIIESTTLDRERDYAAKRKAELADRLVVPSIIAVSLLLVVAAAITRIAGGHPFAGLVTLLLLIKLAGILVSAVLLSYQVDKSNPFIKRICSGTGKANCTAVLDSRGARLFKWLSWSEVGFFYFAGGFISLLLMNDGTPGVLPVLAWMNVLALPYIFYSILYQWRIVKQWCPLCLAVQFLLITEFISSIFFGGSRVYDLFTPSMPMLPVLAVGFILPMLFWFFTKPFFIQAVGGRRFRTELNGLKYNHAIFRTILASQKSIGDLPDDLGIILGNRLANIRIVKVCNPYCDPCARAHPVVSELLSVNPGVSVQVIFNASTVEADPKRPPVKHLLYISRKDPSDTHQAFDDWYMSDVKDYDKFALTHPAKIPVGFGDEEIARMDTWCRENDVGYTPTFFVNGYQLPALYQPEDLLALFGPDAVNAD